MDIVPGPFRPSEWPFRCPQSSIPFRRSERSHSPERRRNDGWSLVECVHRCTYAHTHTQKINFPECGSHYFAGVRRDQPALPLCCPQDAKALSDSVHARGGINPLCHLWIFCLGFKIQGLFWNTRFLNTVQNPKIILE